MSKAAVDHAPAWNREHEAVAARATKTWKGADPFREEAFGVFQQAERAQRLARLVKLLSEFKSHGFELVQASEWSASIGDPFPPEAVEAFKTAAFAAQRMLGSRT